MRSWKFIDAKGWLDAEKILEPLKWKRRQGELEPVELSHDIFDGSVIGCYIDLIFAVMASSGSRPFVIKTHHLTQAKQYMADVKRRGRIAGPAYEKRMRAHFKKYKQEFLEGYSLPDPPTPELRALYDSAAATQHAEHFSGGEYHWREWPLSNVKIEKV